MGRHSAPRATGRRRALVAAAAVLVVLAVVAVAVALTRGNGSSGPTGVGSVPAAASPSAAPSGSLPASSPATTTSPTASSTARPSSSGTGSARPTVAPVPATLTYRVLHTSYLRIRVPGGRTLLEATLRAGASGSFDQPVLEVLCGNAGGVQFRLNGSPRPLGRSGQVVSFVVRKA